MASPFPLEDAEQASESHPKWDPWDGPVKPGFLTGMGFGDDTEHLGPWYRMEQAGVSGLAKATAVMGGIYNSELGAVADFGEAHDIPGSSIVRAGQREFAATESMARNAVKATTPDPATTGGAVQLLHGLYSGATEMLAGAAVGGPLAGAATIGGTEGGSRFQELREKGVDSGTAAASGLLTGAIDAAGAAIPGGFGASLLTRLATGVASNTALGMVSRYADHSILEAGGYQEMAEQQHVWDSTQVMVDMALGATFGAVHHLSAADQHVVDAMRTPENRDAALTANLAFRDRQSAPGVAVDPGAANAHHEALESAGESLQLDRAVDISDSGVTEGKFLSRPPRDYSPEANMLLDSFKESGVMHEESTLKDLEDQLAARRGEAPALEAQPRAVPQPREAAPEVTDTESEKPGTAEQPGMADKAEPSGFDPVTAALEGRPDMQLPEGVKAADALREADTAASTGQSELPTALEAAAGCFARKGM